MTIIATMYAIIKRQSSFFAMAKSERALIPMNLADIAKDTGLDESTVSRVTNGKFATTPFGMFELKYFFSEVVIKNKQNEDGGDISTTKIKEKLRQLIEEEDKTEPLSDQQLAQDLEKAGLAAARRTVAKYREQLGFATARLRKVY
jgi:RNA polymerase sigma-54 factor